MTTMPVTSTSSLRRMSRLRVGLALSAFLGLVSIPFAFVPASSPEGDGPPLAAIVLSVALGLASIVCAIVAWPAGNRIAIRVNAAALLLSILASLPALFVDIQAWIQVSATVAIVLYVVALVLTLRRERDPLAVTD